MQRKWLIPRHSANVCDGVPHGPSPSAVVLPIRKQPTQKHPTGGRDQHRLFGAGRAVAALNGGQLVFQVAGLYPGLDASHLSMPGRR